MQVYSSQKARYKLFLQTFLVICFSQIRHIINFCFKRCQGQELIQAIYYRKLIKTEKKFFFSGETYLVNKRKNMKNSIFEKCCLCVFAKTCFK